MMTTIIFDLGGVILPLDTQATRQKFLQYTKKDIQEWMAFGYPHQIIQKFEMGKISEREFFDELAELLEYNHECYYLKEAWNAMLLPIPKENIDFLLKLKQHYQLILLSNTCETHIHRFEEMLTQKYQINSLEEIFHQVYFSCRIGIRKPDPKIFQKILKDNQLNASEIIYFDDTKTHIEAAQKLQIKSILYPHNQLLENTLKPYIQMKTEIFT